MQPTSFNRRQHLLALGGLISSLYASQAQSQGFPAKPITLIVPFAPGGNVDITARNLAPVLSRNLGQTVVVDNRAGGGGAIGTGFVAQAAPDGYTLLVATPGQISTLPQMFKTPYQVSNFVPLNVATRTPVVIVTRKNDDRFKTAADLLALARAKPGTVNVGHAGPGTPNHLALLQLEDASKCKFNAVPYRGSGPALLDLLGGQIDAVVDQVTSSSQHLKSGALQALVVLGPNAGNMLTGVPTLPQLSLPDFDATTYVGLYAPSGIPAPLQSALSVAINKSISDPQFSSVIRSLGSDISGADANFLKQLLEQESKVSGLMVNQGRLKAE